VEGMLGCGQKRLNSPPSSERRGVLFDFAERPLSSTCHVPASLSGERPPTLQQSGVARAWVLKAPGKLPNDAELDGRLSA